MQLGEVIRRRRMVRAYQPGRAVPAELRERLLRHAQRAPSAGFAQGCAYVVLESPQEREGFWAATAGAREQGEWLARMREAPLLITCWCSERIYRERYAETDKTGADPFSAPYWYVDAGMGVLLMLQTAVDEGLAACFFGIPPQRVDAVRERLGVPAEWAPVGVVSVGYRDATRDPGGTRRARKPAAEVVHRGHWLA